MVEKWERGGGLPRRSAGLAPGAIQPRGIAGQCRSVSLAHPLSDMSQFAAELCEYCADIAPIVPSLYGVP